jgi:hypothetical protein
MGAILRRDPTACEAELDLGEGLRHDAKLSGSTGLSETHRRNFILNRTTNRDKEGQS